MRLSSLFLQPTKFVDPRITIGSKNLSKFYYFMVNLGLIMHIGMLISAGGTTLNEYYDINRFFGSLIFAVGLLTVYLSGFNNMVSIISKLGPLVILFVVFKILSPVFISPKSETITMY